MRSMFPAINSNWISGCWLGNKDSGGGYSPRDTCQLSETQQICAWPVWLDWSNRSSQFSCSLFDLAWTNFSHPSLLRLCFSWSDWSFTMRNNKHNPDSSLYCFYCCRIRPTQRSISRINTFCKSMSMLTFTKILWSLQNWQFLIEHIQYDS